MPKSTKTDTVASQRSKRRTYLIAATFAVLLVLLDVSKVGGNNIRLYAKWIECGRWPVEVVGHVAGEVPYYRSANGFAFALRGGAKYFCTPLEAEQAGYSANPDYYDFPNIRAQEQK